MAEWNGGRGDIHVGEVDGVRAVWADTPGPMTAGLLFGVGHADETFTTAGITHLVEHLALFGIAQPGDHTNGSVDQTRTTLHTTGTAEEIATFLEAVTRQVRDLPLGRLEAERGVLRAEYRSEPNSSVKELLAWRYGMRGFGLFGIGEPLTLHALDGDRVQEWARSRMTKADAVLFLSKPPPAGLRLHLPDAPAAAAAPRPDPTTSTLPWLPAWVGRDQPGATLLGVAPRTHVTSLLVDVYRRRLFQRLRNERAAAYAPGVSLDAADGRWSFLAVSTDLLPERAAELAPELVTVLRDLSREPGHPSAVTEEDLQVARSSVRRHYDDPRAVAGETVTQAWSLLAGVPVVTVDEQLAAVAATTVEDVAQVADRTLRQAIAMVPFAAGPALLWGEAPATTRQPLRGEGARRVGEPTSSKELVVTDEAAGMRSWDSGWVTVPRDHTAAVLAWPDGRRDLICDEGYRLVVEPTEWVDGRELVARIDSRWPAELVVAMPARDPAEIPQPQEAPERKLPWRVRMGRLSTRAELLVGVGLAVAAVLFCLIVLSVRPGAVGYPVLLSLGGIRLFGWWNRRRAARRRAEQGVVDLPPRDATSTEMAS